MERLHKKHLKSKNEYWSMQKWKDLYFCSDCGSCFSRETVIYIIWYTYRYVAMYIGILIFIYSLGLLPGCELAFQFSQWFCVKNNVFTTEKRPRGWSLSPRCCIMHALIKQYRAKCRPLMYSSFYYEQLTQTCCTSHWWGNALVQILDWGYHNFGHFLWL